MPRAIPIALLVVLILSAALRAGDLRSDPPPGPVAVARLAKLETFQFGYEGDGMDPQLLPGTVAFIAVLNAAEPLPLLQALWRDGNAVGRAYALMGFRLLGDPGYAAAAKAYGREDGRIGTRMGCVIDAFSHAEIITFIEQPWLAESLLQDVTKGSPAEQRLQAAKERLAAAGGGASTP